MKRTLKLTLCLMAMFFAFSMQAKIEKSELLGVWTLAQQENGMNIISSYDFKDDNTVTQFLMMNGTSPKMNVVADGTCQYSISDDCIVFKFSASDFNLTAFEIEGIPEEYIGIARQQMMSQMVNVEQKLTDVKIDGNQMTAKVEGQTVTLTRN